MISNSMRAELDRYLEQFLIPEPPVQSHRKRLFESKAKSAKNEAVFYDACMAPDEEIYEAPDESITGAVGSAAQPLFLREEAVSGTVKTGRRLEDLVRELEETFSERVLRLIREKDLDEAEVYKRAFMDRRHFSKIRNDRNYAANKKTVLALAVAMRLSLDETRDLLNSAGYALSRSSRSDMIMQYFFENQVYDMFVINDVLCEYGLPVFE